MTTASDKLRTLFDEFAEDHAKFQEKKNHSAGVRARKKLMEIRRTCADIKAEMLAEVQAQKGPSNA